MKTLRLSIIALLLGTTVSLFASTNASTDEPVNTKVTELKNDVKTNLSSWYSFEHIEPGETRNLLVHYTINSSNEVEVIHVKSNENKLKEEVFSTFEEHPVKADPELQGEIFAIVVQLESR